MFLYNLVVFLIPRRDLGGWLGRCLGKTDLLVGEGEGVGGEGEGGRNRWRGDKRRRERGRVVSV